MSYTITKSVSTDFSSGVGSDALHLAITANESITTSLEAVQVEGDNCNIIFESEPSAGEKTELDSIVAAHDGSPNVQFIYLAPSKLVEASVDVTEDSSWQDLGGVVTTLGSFVSDASKAWGRVVGQAKVSGAGAQMRVIRDSDGEVLMAASHSVGDTSGSWSNIQFWVNQNQPADTDCFILQARLNGATSMQVRYFSMSLLEKVA